jgi:hypothetical protein
MVVFEKETKHMLKYKIHSCPLKNIDNTLAITDDKKAILFQSHISETFQPHNDILNPQHIENVKIYLNSALPYARPIKYFTPNEVKNMITNVRPVRIKEMANNKRKKQKKKTKVCNFLKKRKYI